MDGNDIPSSPSRNRARKRSGRRARGLAVIEREGYWHAHGTIRAGGRSIRVRRSLGLPATAETWDQAWDEVRAIEDDVRGAATGGKRRGDAVAVAVKAYLSRKRRRSLGASTLRILKEVTARFGLRRLNDIPAKDWIDWVDARHASNAVETRERFLNAVVAFFRFAVRHHAMTVVVDFDRDKDARNPRRRARRQIDDLRPELIGLLLASAHISVRAQIAVEWSTGGRVSSVLFGVPVRNVQLAAGRETITFHDTKNGDDVTAALHPSAAAILLDYARWRGNLHRREEPFFLTYRRRAYTDNGRDGGGQNKTAFAAAKRRARRTILESAFAAARAARHEGQRDRALDLLQTARNDARLLRRVTQHWFRHLLATRMRHDIRAAMEQGGWRDERSVLGYIHDVPNARRAAVAAFEDIGTMPTRRTTPDTLTG